MSIMAKLSKLYSHVPAIINPRFKSDLNKILLFFFILLPLPSFAGKLILGQQFPLEEIPIFQSFNLKAPLNSLELSKYRGTPLLIKVWSHDCLACLKSIPKLKKKLKAHPGKFNILSVTSFKTKSDLKSTLKVIKKKKINYPTIILEAEDFKGTVNRTLSYSSLPYYILLSSHQKILWEGNIDQKAIQAHWNGYLTHRHPNMVEQLELLLKNSKSEDELLSFNFDFIDQLSP